MIIKKPALSGEKNNALVIKAREEYLSSNGQNQTLMQEAIERNMGLVYCAVNKFHNLFSKHGILEDAYSEGVLQLYKCIMGYEENKGWFSTFAGFCLTNCVNMRLRELKKKYSCVSLDDKFINSKGDESTYWDYVEDKNSANFEDEALDSIEEKNIFKALPIIFSASEFNMFKLRSQDMSLREIGKFYNIGHSMMSRKMARLEGYIEEIKIFRDVKDINAYIKQNNLSGRQADEKIARYQLARFIYQDQKIQFDRCFEFISFDYRFKGMMKKTQAVFKNPKKIDFIFKTLAYYCGAQLEQSKKMEESGQKISVRQSEVKLNETLSSLMDFVSDYNKQGNLCFKDYSEKDLAIISHYFKNLKEPIEKYAKRHNIKLTFENKKLDMAQQKVIAEMKEKV